MVAANERLRTLADRMRTYRYDDFGEHLEIAAEHETGKPDCTALGVQGKIHAVEIKRPRHKFEIANYDRIEKYIQAFRTIFAYHELISIDFPKGRYILPICDGENISDTTRRETISSNKKIIKS